MALLAVVIIWLYDFNNNGPLNMTPADRELIAKQLPAIHASVNDDEGNEIDSAQAGAGPAREARNKYLNRIGVTDGGTSDTEPLLQ